MAQNDVAVQQSGVQASEVQVVQGFSSVVAGSKATGMVLASDFRGPIAGWTGGFWWENGTRPEKEELIWESAPCPAQADTCLVFTGAMSTMPYATEFANQADLYVNGEHALTFDVGLQPPITWGEDYLRRWSNGEFQLEFQAKQFQSPFEGHHRQFNLRGVNGLFRLWVPARLVRPEQPVRIEVRMQPRAHDTISWFAILDRQDSGELSLESLAQEVLTLQRENIRLRETLNALAQKLHPEFFPSPLALEHSLVFTHGRNWVGVPDILRLHNGDIFVTFRESSEHVSNDGMICTIRSTDNGQTWGDYQVIAAEVGTDYRDASVTQLRNGALLMTWFDALNNDRETGVRIFDRAVDPSQIKGWRGPNKVYFCHSFDQGHTWNTPKTLDPTPLLFNHTVEPCVELPTGRILMPVYGETADRRLTVTAYCSDDGGFTWRYLSTMLVRPEDETMAMEYLETSIALTGSGKVISISRSEADGMWQTISHDMGQTWDPPRRLPFPPNTQPNVIRLSDGRLLLSYGNRRTAPRTIHARLSDDEGANWSEPLVLRDDLPDRDMGYACSVELEPGVMGSRILTVYWCNMFDRFALYGTTWTPPERSSH